jgi:hypothetical protein
MAGKGLRERKLTVDSLKLKERTSGELSAGTPRERRRGEPFVGELALEENMGKGSTGLARR